MDNLLLLTPSPPTTTPQRCYDIEEPPLLSLTTSPLVNQHPTASTLRPSPLPLPSLLPLCIPLLRNARCRHPQPSLRPDCTIHHTSFRKAPPQSPHSAPSSTILSSNGNIIPRHPHTSPSSDTLLLRRRPSLSEASNQTTLDKTIMEWSLDFCLACDKQCDGHVYCSEACRLAEYEKPSSTAGSAASSPVTPRGPVSWPATRSHHGFYMEPAYNFRKAQPYGTTPTRSDFSSLVRAHVPSTKTVLTPSSSQSSLFSMQSASSTASSASEPAQLSDDARKALRAYASSFDQSRRSRRQSSH